MTAEEVGLRWLLWWCRESASGSIESMNVRSAICPVRVGREREVAALRENADARRTSFISGPAGVGKSRLTSEALTIAAERSMLAIVGHCTLDQATPFEPFAGAIRRRTRMMGETELAVLFSGGASLAAALVPDVARAIGYELETPAQPDLFAALWQLLHRIAGTSGAILLLEDLHWADADTLRLLTYLVRESDDLDLWIVGTYRGDEVHRRHALAPVLAELSRERRFDEITLGPLTRDELTAMVTAIFDSSDVSSEFVDALFERTQGNPFFVEELLKVLIERGDVAIEAGDWVQRDLSSIEMPTTVRETLLARVRAMSPAASSLMHLASLEGDRLDAAVLSAASGQSADEVDGVIADALSQQLLAESRDAAGVRFVFRHALTREALCDEMVGPEKRQGHLRLAAGIVAAHPHSLDDYATSLADHYLEGGERARAIEWGWRAARQAAGSFAVDEAARRFEQVLGLMSSDDESRLDLLLEALSAMTTTPSIGLASISNERIGRAFAIEARQIAQVRGDPVAETRALEAIATLASNRGDTPGAVELLREALEIVHGHDDFLESWIYALLCGYLTRIDHIGEVTERLPEAMALAGHAGNHLAFSRLHVIAMMNASFGPDFSASLAAARDEARLAGSPRAEHSLEQTAGYVSLWCGEFELSQRSFERSLAIGEQLSPHDRYTAAGYVWLLSLMGRYDDIAVRPLLGRGGDSVPSRIVELTGLCEVAERRGSEDLDDLVDEIWRITSTTGESQRSVPALSARARWLLIREGVESSSEAFWEVIDKTVSARGRGSHWLFSPDFAAATLLGDHAFELDRWASAVAQVTANDPHPHNRAADEFVQGCRLVSQSNWDEGRERLDAARAMYEAMPCPARVAETHLVLAELAQRSGDLEGSSSSLRAANEVADSIGAAALVERARYNSGRSAGATMLATLMFTDIVSSTEHARRIGDAAWRSLLDRHDALVRRELERFSGREVKTTGDGFLAAFDSPGQAVRCAQSVRQALNAVGIKVRTGLHTGECQIVGNDLRGQAVHLAARVCSEAGADEILVTSTVRDLVSGTGISLTEHGSVELKGFDEPWRLYAA